MIIDKMRLIDTHCHVDLYPDYSKVIDEIESAQIYTMAVTNLPSVFRHCLALTEGKRFIKTALGLHPQLVRERHLELALMLELIPETRYIGEVGLDFITQDKEERETQQRVFSKILERCAQSGNKILTVHSRRAAGRVIDIIGQSYQSKVILHWFSGSQRELRQAISYGLYFSVNTSMLANEKGRQTIATIPQDRLLTETDGPFVKVDGRPARPSDVGRVIDGLAKFLRLERGEVCSIIVSNFKRVLMET